MSENRNADSGETTTGHVWDDDLADYTNQPPRWWMIGLAVSAIWVVVYFVMYPSIPIATSGTFTPGIGLPGSGQWTAIKEMEADQKDVDDVRGKFEKKLKDMAPAAILADKELSEYVSRSGKVLFSDNCAACHGQNGIGTTDKQGLFAPILNDDDWLFGGTVDQIYESIANGRQGMMMAHKSSLNDEEIKALAGAVSQGNPTATPLFTEKGCVGCHGADGKGMQAMGSANLADKVWRFAGTPEGIKYTIAHGVNDPGDKETRVAIMPNFTAAGKLSAVEMKKLAVYVFRFGGGKAADPAPAAQ
ncbi:MAG: c-type cytochrome [Nitrosomonadales bacterium]|nr:c-type cytochrome [Nitrosomonadales bacterium]